MAGMAIKTPPINQDLPFIKPGPTWLDHFKPGLHKPFKISGGPQFIGVSGGLAMASMAYETQVVQYLPFPQFPLSTKVELLINGTWLDVTDFVYYRDGITITRGLPDETQSVTPSQMTLTLDNRDGRFSPNNPLGAYSPYLTRNVQMRTSVINQASADGTPYSGYRFWGEVSSWPPRWDSSADRCVLPDHRVGRAPEVRPGREARLDAAGSTTRRSAAISRLMRTGPVRMAPARLK